MKRATHVTAYRYATQSRGIPVTCRAAAYLAACRLDAIARPSRDALRRLEAAEDWMRHATEVAR